MAFEGLDFLRLDELLSEEERRARESVRDFVSREFLPRVQEHVRRDGSFPMELVPRMAELGLFGANLHGFGCAPSPRCRAAWSCSRSTAAAATRIRSAGCRRWRRAGRSAASGSPSPAS